MTRSNASAAASAATASAAMAPSSQRLRRKAGMRALTSSASAT